MKNTGLQGTTITCYNYFDFLDFLGRSQLDGLGNDFENVVLDYDTYGNDSYYEYTFKIKPWTKPKHAEVLQKVMEKAGIENGESILFWVSW